MDNAIVVINSDHGETLYDHDCFFDHHGYLRYGSARTFDHALPGKRSRPESVSAGINLHQDLMPTLLELAGIETEIQFDGKSLIPLITGEVASYMTVNFISPNAPGCANTVGALRNGN